jgi:preprotein translocase subunit SecF
MDFIGNRKYLFAFSLALLVIAIAGLSFNWFAKGEPMNFGIDFTGGTLLIVRLEKPVAVSDVRGVLSKHGLQESEIQKVGDSDISIRAMMVDDQKRQALVADLNSSLGGAELLEADMIGPTIGKELRTQAVWALLIASVGMLIYVAFRFEFKYAVAAILALYHDAIITTGIMAILWRDINTTFVAAILTILGYSINDTIVIFDRIRENTKRSAGKKTDFKTIANNAIMSTLARSINTVLTVVVMVIMLLVFGGATIREFALTLLFGFCFGCYSSIFVAPQIVSLLKDME